MNQLKEKIRTIPNWSKQGIMFRDITTLLKDKEGFLIHPIAEEIPGNGIDENCDGKDY